MEIIENKTVKNGKITINMPPELENTQIEVRARILADSKQGKSELIYQTLTKISEIDGAYRGIDPIVWQKENRRDIKNDY